MTTAREIRSKIGSVKSTQKITRAMEMVAASKMRKAQDRMLASRPFADKIREVIGHLAKSHPEFHHIFLQQREVKRAGFIVVTSDRGLCGSLNVNLLKTVIKQHKKWDDKNIPVELCLYGHKAEAFFKRAGGDITGFANHIGDMPSLQTILGVVKIMFEKYAKKELDVLYIFYNQYINTMTQKPEMLKIFPLEPKDTDKLNYYWDYIYEPEAKDVLNVLLHRYVESQVYHAVVENIACEQAARMIAMKNATENAGDIIDELNLAYNKARQAAITRELADIIAGAEAISSE